MSPSKTGRSQFRLLQDVGTSRRPPPVTPRCQASLGRLPSSSFATRMTKLTRHRRYRGGTRDRQNSICYRSMSPSTRPTITESMLEPW